MLLAKLISRIPQAATESLAALFVLMPVAVQSYSTVGLLNPPAAELAPAEPEDAPCQRNEAMVSASEAQEAQKIAHGARPRQAIRAMRRVQRGEASWYGPRFHGRKTASGEIFDQTKLTAAHKTLPLGSRARVTNLENGASIEVEINDRGPYIPGRIIDLSHAAAGALNMVEAGVVLVRVELLNAEEVES